MDDIQAENGPEQSFITTSTHLRFALDKNSHEALMSSPLLTAPMTRGQRLEDRFFDTADYALAQRMITLRVRKAGKYLTLAVIHDRQIVEADLHDSMPDLTVLGPDWLGILNKIIDGAALKQVASTKLTKTTRQFQGVTLVFETGMLNPDEQNKPFRELDLIAAEPVRAETALILAGLFCLRQQPVPSSLQAVRLAGGPAPTVYKAVAGLDGDPCLDDAITAIISTCLAQFRANWPVFYDGDAIRAIHQMRVAMRRLRSALGLFNRALPTPEFLTLRHEAKRIAGNMGEARNWDVFIETLQTGPMAVFDHEVGFAALEAQCKAYQQAAHKQVDALLQHPDTTRFLLHAEAFLARRGWRTNLSAEALPHLAEPARLIAAQTLARLHRRLRKHGKKLMRLPVAERHLVRIELKKLRYTSEFFGNLFKPDNRVRAFNRAACDLQDELGKLNDMATAEALISRLHSSMPEAQRALGIVLGWTAHAALHEPKDLQVAWKAFLNTRLFT